MIAGKKLSAWLPFFSGAQFTSLAAREVNCAPEKKGGTIMNQQLIRELSQITEEEQRILDGDPSIDPAIYSDSPAFVIDSRKMLQKGKLIQVRPHTRFVHFPRHTHNYVEMIYMCSGQTVHVINGSKIVLRTGELLILNQHATRNLTRLSRRYCRKFYYSS